LLLCVLIFYVTKYPLSVFRAQHELPGLGSVKIKNKKKKKRRRWQYQLIYFIKELILFLKLM
jgi:hypothetical protein